MKERENQGDFMSSELCLYSKEVFSEAENTPKNSRIWTKEETICFGRYILGKKSSPAFRTNDSNTSWVASRILWPAR